MSSALRDSSYSFWRAKFLRPDPRIEQFFINYNKMRGRVFKPTARGGAAEGMKLVKRSTGDQLREEHFFVGSSNKFGVALRKHLKKANKLVGSQA